MAEEPKSASQIAAELNFKLSWGLVHLGYNVPDNYACSNQATHAIITETWEHSDAIPTEKAILAAYDEWVIAQAKIKYQSDRQPLYPNIGDQLDDLYKEGAFSADMTAKIKKVKDDNPKP